MPCEKLHDYQVQLCHYALEAPWTHRAFPGFADFVRDRLDPRLFAYLRSVAEAEDPIEQPLLLGDREFQELVFCFSDAPLHFDRAWSPDRHLHRRAVDCVREIRCELAGEYAEEWGRASTQFARELEADGLRLSDGVELVRRWVREARRLLRAMGAAHRLPPPDGPFPTPTSDTATSPQYTAEGEETPARQTTPASENAIVATPDAPNLNGLLQQVSAALELLGRSAPVPEAFSKEDAARFIGVDVPAIEYLIRTKKIAYVQYGAQRGRVIPVESLREFLRDHRQPTAAELLRRRGKA